MDNPNPIKYSDLIKQDNSITDLIGQLETLIEKYEDIRSKVQSSANDMAKSMKSFSGATQEQREQIQLVTKESENLLKEYEDTTKTLKVLNEKYKDGNLALKEFTKIQKLVDEVNRSAEGSYNRLSAQYRLNKIRLNEMSQAEREGTKAGRELEAETKAIYERMNDLQKATGKAQLQVGQYERALGGLLGVNYKVVEALTDSSKAATLFSGAIKALAGPIGIAIGLVGGITAAFKLFKDSIHETQTTGDALDYAVGEWEGTWSVFKKSVSTVDFSGFIAGARQAAAAGRELKEVLDETFERTNSTRLLRASMSEENAILQEKMRDQGRTLDERIQAGKDYLANMEPIYEQEKDSAKRNADAQLDYLFAVTNRERGLTEEQEKLAKQRLANYIRDYNINEDDIKLAKRYLQAEKDVAAAEDELRKAESVATNKYYDEERQKAQKRINSATAETKELAKIVKQYNLASNSELEAYVAAQEKYLNAQAAAYNDNRRIVTMLNNLEAQKTKDAQNAAKARTAATEKAAKDAAKAAEDEAKAIAEAAEKAIRDERQILNFQLQSIQLEMQSVESGTREMLDLRLKMIAKQREIELFENRNKAENLRQDEAKINAKYDAMVLRENAKFNDEIARRDLQALQSLEQSEFNMTQRNERQKTIFRLEQEAARLRVILGMNEISEEKLTDMEVAAIQARIDEIDALRERVPYNNIWEVLGLNIDSEQQQAITSAVNAVVDAMGGIIDAWRESADAAVKSAETQVSAAQKIVDAQIEARDKGYASDVKNAQKELALAKKNQQKALEDRRKADIAAIALDSAVQASSLITASANIWKAFSSIPYVGPALAVAAMTLMWGSFAASKIKAIQATANTETYGEGTVEMLEGGSHASGHDIDLGRKKDGTRRRAEGGEYFAIINKRNSRKYRGVIPDVINSFNDGTFADKYQRANASMAGYAVQMIGCGTDVSNLERNVDAIRRQGDESRMFDNVGNLIVRHKNLTRIYRS